MDEEQERSRFEAWAKPLGRGTKEYLVPMTGERLYADHYTDVAWDAWKARAALSQPASEPVAWIVECEIAGKWVPQFPARPTRLGSEMDMETFKTPFKRVSPLYASQPASEPVGVVLTRMNQETGETKTAPELYPAFADLPARTLLYASQPASPAPEARHLGNLLAVIHGDGGHYQDEHGTGKAVEDATAKVVDWCHRATAPEATHGWVLVPRDPCTPLPDYEECARQASEATGLPSQYPSAWLSIFIREINRWCEHRAAPTAERVAWVKGHSAGWDAALKSEADAGGEKK